MKNRKHIYTNILTIKRHSFTIRSLFIIRAILCAIVTTIAGNIAAQSIVGTIDFSSVGEGKDVMPRNIAVNPSSNLIYVSSKNDENVIVIDGLTNEVADIIKVNGLPQSITVNPVTNRIYVISYPQSEKLKISASTQISDPFEDVVNVINGSTNKVVDDFKVGFDPVEIAVNPITNLIYVNEFENMYRVIDGNTHEVVGNINNVIHIGINPDANKIYVSDHNQVKALDGATNQVVANIDLKDDHNVSSKIIGVNPATNLIYTPVGFHKDNNLETNVRVIDGWTNEVIYLIPLNGWFNAIEINPTTNHIYLSDITNNFVSVIDGLTNDLIASIDVDGRPIALAINAETNLVYVVKKDSSDITVISDVKTQGSEFLADFTAAPTNRGIPLTVKFSDLSSGFIDKWLWNFGDGETSSDQNPTHKYEKAGTFTVSLTIEGPAGADTEKKNDFIKVLPPPPPIANFRADPTEGSVLFVVKFTELSFGAIDKWLWDFGDGQTSNEQSAVHEYMEEGTFTVSLTVNGPQGADTETKRNMISAFPPIADFLANPIRGNVPESVQFTDLSSGTIDSWSWDFGDGELSTEQNPIHEYIQKGIFTVTLTINGAKGSDTETKESFIAITSAVAVATIDLGNPKIDNNANPQGVAVNSITNRIYVANANSNNVSVIDGATNAEIGSIKVGEFPFGIDVNHIANRIYVVNVKDSNVSVIDGNTNTVVSSIDVENDTRNIAVNHVTNRIYVSGGETHKVTVINGETGKVAASIAGGLFPRDIAINTQTNRIYVANGGDNSVSVIDGSTNSVIALIEGLGLDNIPGANEQSFGLAVNPLTNRLYVSNGSTDKVNVIDGITNEAGAIIELADFPQGITVNTSTNHIYVAGLKGGNVTVIDGDDNLVLGTVKVGKQPFSLCANPGTDLIYVANMLSDNVTVIFDDGGVLRPTIMQVNPTSANKSIRMQAATVTVFDQKGLPMTGVKVEASANGAGVKVRPSSATTGPDGAAKFKFKFGFASNNGKITFSVGDISAAINQN